MGSKPQTCRHCDIEFRRPHVDGIPDDRCTRCDDEIKALWPERELTTTRWTSKTCTQCGHATAATVSDDKPVCSGCARCHEELSARPDLRDEPIPYAPPDAVNHPTHYTQGGVECIDALAAATVGKAGIEAVCTANVIKYLWRYEAKNGAEDVRKARWYVERLLAELEGEQ